jgi:hypothetical protein
MDKSNFDRFMQTTRVRMNSKNNLSSRQGGTSIARGSSGVKKGFNQTTVGAGLGVQPITAIYNVSTKKSGKSKAELSSKGAMIKRGKEDAENLNHLLPLFQKKAKDPSKAIRGAS